MREKDQIRLLRGALRELLNKVDFTNGACSGREIVALVLGRESLERANAAMQETTPPDSGWSLPDDPPVTALRLQDLCREPITPIPSVGWLRALATLARATGEQIDRQRRDHDANEDVYSDTIKRMRRATTNMGFAASYTDRAADDMAKNVEAES